MVVQNKYFDYPAWYIVLLDADGVLHQVSVDAMTYYALEVGDIVSDDGCRRLR